jgi:hypothetical protein
MARASKSKHSSKQKRRASKMERGHQNRGVSKKESKTRAWTSANKMTGGKRSASGRGRGMTKSSARKGGRKSHR